MLVKIVDLAGLAEAKKSPFFAPPQERLIVLPISD
jgi:hypothetical protein